MRQSLPYQLRFACFRFVMKSVHLSCASRKFFKCLLYMADKCLWAWAWPLVDVSRSLNVEVTQYEQKCWVVLVDSSGSPWEQGLFGPYCFSPPLSLTPSITLCGLLLILLFFFLLREMLRYGLQEISDLVKSLLPKLEIPEYFNSSGWPLNETPPLVINMSLSTFMIFWNIICHSFYLHRASFKLLKMWVIFLQLLTITHHGQAVLKTNYEKPGLERVQGLWNVCSLLWVVDFWTLAMELPPLRNEEPDARLRNGLPIWEIGQGQRN